MISKHVLAPALALLLALAPIKVVPAAADDTIDFTLNWVAGGDTAPFYFAVNSGRYAAAGLDVVIEQGKGSTVAVQKVGAGVLPLGYADLGTALVGKSRGAHVVSVMNVYANSPYGLYWRKSSGITDVVDLVGKKIGNPPGDAARSMWPALAKAVGIDPKSVTWVNIPPNAKLSALMSGAIDATTSFYNIHHIFQRELGDDMGFLAWKDRGVNPYGNSVIVNRDYFAENPDVVRRFVSVTQQAWADCVREPKPCIDALLSSVSGLKYDNELDNWKLVTELMTDDISRTVALGYHDPGRMAADYDLIATYFDIKAPFDVTDVYTNDLIDMAIKMP